MSTADEADAMPTTQLIAASAQLQKTLSDLDARWSQLRAGELAALNAKLKAAGLAEII